MECNKDITDTLAKQKSFDFNVFIENKKVTSALHEETNKTVF